MITKILKTTPDLYPICNIRVIDGDTLEAEVVLPFNTRVQKRIRLKGWWADELDGPYRSAGLTAKYLVEIFITGKVLWLWSSSCRLDKYGRVIGALVHNGRLVLPSDVLGTHALTEKEHKLRSDQAKASRAQARAWPNDQGSMTTAEAKSKRPTNDPSSIYWCHNCQIEHHGLECCARLPVAKAKNPGAAAPSA